MQQYTIPSRLYECFQVTALLVMVFLSRALAPAPASTEHGKNEKNKTRRSSKDTDRTNHPPYHQHKIHWFKDAGAGRPTPWREVSQTSTTADRLRLQSAHLMKQLG